ncbi:hypothetical protein BKA58DRAFT_176555 [Alternaria rosae]|uniref:uncharacterized protein n=1 Tax=Alternaria rosae TaxID=1187941 RepID=UPI001E8CFD11|nr:uncharacterized protein BKA58DRAFT_176555 [Alternaria rosae]KAH6870419.1 hypothetical protein BKA58DRAFT_176555 [Alternaria rosae]
MAFTRSIFAMLFFTLCLAIQASPVSATLSARYKSPFSAFLLPREGDNNDNDFTDSQKAGLYAVIFLSVTILWLWFVMGITVAILRKTNDKTFWVNFKDGLLFKKDVGYLSGGVADE